MSSIAPSGLGLVRIPPGGCALRACPRLVSSAPLGPKTEFRDRNQPRTAPWISRHKTAGYEEPEVRSQKPESEVLDFQRIAAARQERKEFVIGDLQFVIESSPFQVVKWQITNPKFTRQVNILSPDF
jgi:hypothetical protein